MGSIRSLYKTSGLGFLNSVHLMGGHLVVFMALSGQLVRYLHVEKKKLLRYSYVFLSVTATITYIQYNTGALYSLGIHSMDTIALHFTLL